MSSIYRVMPADLFDRLLALMDTPDVRQAEFRALFDSAPVAIAFVSQDGTFLRVNATYCHLLGYAAGELEGVRRFQDITHPEDVDIDMAEAEKVAAGVRATYRLSKRYIHKRGHVVPVDLQVDRVSDAAGVFVHFVAHVTPLTVSEEFYRVQQNADGSFGLRPFFPLVKALTDHWKATLLTIGALVGSAGVVLRNHYLTSAMLEVQTQKLDYAARELDELRADYRRREKKIEELTQELRETARIMRTAPMPTDVDKKDDKNEKDHDQGGKDD